MAALIGEVQKTQTHGKRAAGGCAGLGCWLEVAGMAAQLWEPTKKH